MVRGATARTRTRLNRDQIVGFWAAWAGWLLDGMDGVIYALVLVPALTELLPRSGIAASAGNIGYIGSILFALFLVGWDSVSSGDRSATATVAREPSRRPC